MAKKGTRRVTSSDVARASGVSRATVGYVLNNDPRQTISQETRERILKAVEELGYRPFAPARILREGYSHLVLVVLPFEQVDPDLARSLKELEMNLAMRGFTLIWHVGSHNIAGKTHPSFNLTPAVIISFVSEDQPAMKAFIQQFNVPVISLLNAGQEVGRTQVSYLVQKGRQRRMVFAAPERDDLRRLIKNRLEGVRQGCAQFGLEPPLVRVVPSSRAGARAVIADLLADCPPPLNICCYNDEVANAVLAALLDEGVRVPESVAVIGCDDLILAQFTQPPLTTIRISNHFGQDAFVEALLAAIPGGPLPEVPPFSYEIVERDSA